MLQGNTTEALMTSSSLNVLQKNGYDITEDISQHDSNNNTGPSEWKSEININIQF